MRRDLHQNKWNREPYSFFFALSAWTFHWNSQFQSPPFAFRMLEFGLFMHWGPVSQWGTEISFPLVCKSFPCNMAGPNRTTITANNTSQLQAHRQAYADLAKTFNPTKFDPASMAKLAKAVGFKYLVFTAEHCDGFASFNTSISTYNILNTPYKKDIFGMLAEAFRAEGLKVGTYFCPSTWNNDNYWAPNALTAFGPVCRPNYNPPDDPTRWDAYLKYLHGQLEEIAVQYSPDLLWIDCGLSPTYFDTMVEQVAPLFVKQNPDVVIQVRGTGNWEDYLELGDHSESQAPSIMGQPFMTAGVHFEVPSTLGGQWAFNPDAHYKSAEEVIGNLLLITAKGGNYLVNLGPGPDGLWPESGVEVFQNIASWMAINSEAIHNTTPLWPSNYGVHLPSGQSYSLYVTYSSASSAIYVSVSAESVTNGTLVIPFIRPSNFAHTISTVQFLGIEKPCTFSLNDTGLFVMFQLPLVPVQLGSYWSQTNEDMAPCATRGCSIYTNDHYVLADNESYCFRNPGEGLIPLYLIFDGTYMDNALTNDPSQHPGYENVRTECYAYAAAGESRVPLDLYWNEERKDLWTLSSEHSRQQALSSGYKMNRTIGYGIDNPAQLGDAAELRYYYVFKISYQPPRDDDEVTV
ncbi:tissue alpha-L-fucosidase-like isoform X2 [Oscarella lobularis]|uniref:tissue alpha-L-fucosidase-like isoform X2 n=1 Tax=Oscarella lobularis TaxID=121494 RepID=UPI00331394A7